MLIIIGIFFLTQINSQKNEIKKIFANFYEGCLEDTVHLQYKPIKLKQSVINCTVDAACESELIEVGCFFLCVSSVSSLPEGTTLRFCTSRMTRDPIMWRLG